YYVGGKRKLGQETLRHLAEEHRARAWGQDMSVPAAQQIEHLSRRQALDLLHAMLDYLLDNSLSRNDLPLERIFTRVELESAPMRNMLLSYMAPYQETPYRLLAQLTGLSVRSPELLVVSHCIFGQVMLSECHRLVILNKMGTKHISPALRQQIKEVVWRHTLAILNSYQKGTKRK
ncbi:MAG: DUF1956 domain-containing protein, partial [Elusimicrobiaceae bacterium]|nr:DUF1956 domain-containing protein [Elusimicrobiaceae bacterium]